MTDQHQHTTESGDIEARCLRCADEGYDCSPSDGPVACPGEVCASCDHSFYGALRRDLPDPERALTVERRTCDQWCDPQTGVHAPWCGDVRTPPEGQAP